MLKSPNTVDTDTYGGHGAHLLHGRITNAVLSSAYRVHSRLGPGLLERPYRICMCHELTRLRVPFEVEKRLPIVYDGIEIPIGYRVDLLVDKKVIVEIKSVETVLPVHEAQVVSYLRLSGLRVGLLLNFNVARLRDGIRRKINGY